MFRFFGGKPQTKTENNSDSEHLITLKDIKKVYKTEAGDFLALRGIDLNIDSGEFVGVVGNRAVASPRSLT